MIPRRFHSRLSVILRVFTWLLAFIALAPAYAQLPADPYLRNPRLGITFISSADHSASEQRYRQALLLGAGWNRFPVYWQWIETSPGSFDWTRYDRVVADDIRYGLQINAILLGIPDFQREGDIMRGLSEPVFSDGSNTLGGGKSINPNNPYASFVYQTVQRYKPGGTLAQTLGWRADQGIRVWEAWNEPDLSLFWTGGVQSYARLLQVTYLAVRAADSNGGVMFGGLAYINPEQSDWLDQTLAVIAQDAQRHTYNWYFDIAAVHSYSSAPRSGYVVRRARSTLARYGLTRPIWLNESGVPVWDDYPGPTWAANDPASRLYRSTMAQQAAYVVQSTAYAWAAGAEIVFHHQLYDDCGNQPGGTDFPPTATDRAGDAYGLLRNTGIEGCYTQHPQRGTARPAAAAFNLIARLFSGAPFSSGVTLDLNGQGSVIAFERAETSERIYVLWNRTTIPLTFDIPASGAQGMLYGVDNSDFVVFPNGRVFQIGTPPSRAGDEEAFGGSPFILVQTVDPRLQGVDPLVIALEDQAGSILATAVAATPGPIVAQYGSVLAPALPLATGVVLPTIVPTATPDPTQPDTMPPTATVLPLPVISPATFTVRWSGQDDRGIEAYLIWVQVNGGEWQPWLETSDTQADYTGQPGSTYAFAAWARDTSGNWSASTEIVAQATTAVR